jgi:hypothetical protein
MKKCDIQPHIHKWLTKIPPQDLLDISRLYIVRKNDISDASGKYTPTLFNITIVWDNPHDENSFLFKLFSIFTENTLYHEIGHHVHRDGFGVIPDQEREADRYAYSIFRRNHFFLGSVLQVLSRLGVRSERNYYRWGL